MISIKVMSPLVTPSNADVRKNVFPCLFSAHNTLSL